MAEAACAYTKMDGTDLTVYGLEIITCSCSAFLQVITKGEQSFVLRVYYWTRNAVKSLSARGCVTLCMQSAKSSPALPSLGGCWPPSPLLELLLQFEKALTL